MSIEDREPIRKVEWLCIIFLPVSFCWGLADTFFANPSSQPMPAQTRHAHPRTSRVGGRSKQEAAVSYLD
eukprot:scaffold280792_cov42-Attheya_sp.AAC.1